MLRPTVSPVPHAGPSPHAPQQKDLVLASLVRSTKDFGKK